MSLDLCHHYVCTSYGLQLASGIAFILCAWSWPRSPTSQLRFLNAHVQCELDDFAVPLNDLHCHAGGDLVVALEAPSGGLAIHFGGSRLIERLTISLNQMCNIFHNIPQSARVPKLSCMSSSCRPLSLNVTSAS